MGCRGSILAAASPGASLDSDVPSNQRMREGFRGAHYDESNGRNSARFAAGGDNSCFRTPSAARASLTDAGIMHLCNMLRNEEMIAVCEGATISVLVDTMEELRSSGQKDAILLSVLRTLLLLCRSWPGNAQGAEPRLVDELLSVMGSEEWNTEEARKLALSALAALMERFDMSQGDDMFRSNAFRGSNAGFECPIFGCCACPTRHHSEVADPTTRKCRYRSERGWDQDAPSFRQEFWRGLDKDIRDKVPRRFARHVSRGR